MVAPSHPLTFSTAPGSAFGKARGGVSRALRFTPGLSSYSMPYRSLPGNRKKGLIATAAGLAVVGLLIAGYSLWPAHKHGGHSGAGTSTTHTAAGAGGATAAGGTENNAPSGSIVAGSGNDAARGATIVVLDDLGDPWLYSGGGYSRCIVSGVVNAFCAKNDPHHWRRDTRAAAHQTFEAGASNPHEVRRAPYVPGREAAGAQTGQGEHQVVTHPGYMPHRDEATAAASGGHEVVTHPGYIPGRGQPGGVAAAAIRPAAEGRAGSFSSGPSPHPGGTHTGKTGR